MTCAKGFAIMIAISLRKPGGRLSGPAAFLCLSFFSLTNTRDSDGYQFKSKSGFHFGLVWR